MMMSIMMMSIVMMLIMMLMMRMMVMMRPMEIEMMKRKQKLNENYFGGLCCENDT